MPSRTQYTVPAVCMNVQSDVILENLTYLPKSNSEFSKPNPNLAGNVVCRQCHLATGPPSSTVETYATLRPKSPSTPLSPLTLTDVASHCRHFHLSSEPLLAPSSSRLSRRFQLATGEIFYSSILKKNYL